MAFLPFNIAKQKKLNVIIAGGGYAGLAALTNLLQFAPDTHITLIDPRDSHVKITHLHETFRYPLSDFLIPFSVIAQRFGCRYLQATLDLSPDSLQTYQEKRQLIVNEETLDFDYLLVASGCGDVADRSDTGNVLHLSDFMTTSGPDLLTPYLDRNRSAAPIISVVGGGATGIQFLFEIKQFLNRIQCKAKLQLIHSGEHVLNQFPDGFGSYAESRMHESDIAFHPNTHYREQQSGEILLTEKETKNQYELPSDLTLLFLGKKQQVSFTANVFGQIIVNKTPLPNVFTAGDCSHYQSPGSNSLSAQSAVRKGKLVARNILRHAGFPGILEPYLHQDLGYVVNLGASDAVGWLVAEGNLVTGISALAIKEIVEAQYDLLLAGIDTYLV